jgi:hypothetical protein
VAQQDALILLHRERGDDAAGKAIVGDAIVGADPAKGRREADEEDQPGEQSSKRHPHILCDAIDP